MALRLLALCVLALAVAAAAHAATPTRTNGCLKRHHVLVAGKSPKAITRFGVPVAKLESFSFHGVPPKVYDSGSLVFERTHAIAAAAQKTLFGKLAAQEIRLSGGKVSPYRIRLNLRNTEKVVGNVVVLWNSYPQKAVAKSVVYGCLR